jgi:hypothetical protein
LAEAVTVGAAPSGITWYICTDVWTTPTTVVAPQWCDVAFWY